MTQALMGPTEEKYSTFPEVIDNYFTSKSVIIRTFPVEFLSVAEAEYPDFQITSAQQYYEYLIQEIEFWTINDPQNRFKDFSHVSNLKSAKTSFESAKNSTSDHYLKQSIDVLSNGCLYSKTHLTSVLLSYKDEHDYFITGFKLCLQNSPTASFSNNIGHINGYIAGLAYKKTYQTYVELSSEKIGKLSSMVDSAYQNYADLNSKYTCSFHNHESQIAQFKQNVADSISSIETEKENFFKNANSKLKSLEETYREKLRLEAPADYWKKLKNSYNVQGIVWIGISVLIAAAIIAFLIFILFNAGLVISEKATWIDNVKNSAILTVVTSIGIYVLRLTTKMTLSSFHLSRDAKERENLSMFYLSLIEKSAVTDKERAIVLNSLFSRSDTGLLKGDSSPSMSGNISDLVEVFKNTKPN